MSNVSTNDELSAFLGGLGLEVQRKIPDITKPWMKHHEFVLVRSVAEVQDIVTKAIAFGRCALDLETEGLDTRVFYDPEGKPYTKHRVVGYCLAYGDAKVGYYVPVRHTPNDDGEDLNVDPVGVEAEITRLCRASQPEMKEGVQLGSLEIVKPPQVVIEFWHASFDQEMLYPVTGIDFWHPESFDDGYLASFVINTSDDGIGLKRKAEEKLRDPEGNPYEMIELGELFPTRTRKQGYNFKTLSPDEPGVVKYACSDAICTRLLCSLPDLIGVMKDPRFALTYRREKQVAQVKRVLERNRVCVDRERVKEILVGVEADRDRLKAQIIELAASRGFHGFDPGSAKQLGEFLFSSSGLDIRSSNESIEFPGGKPPKSEKSGQYATGAEVLEKFQQELGENCPPVFEWVLQYRQQDKLINTYLESLRDNPDENNELRVQFNQTGTSTGRFTAPAGEVSQGYGGVPFHGIPGESVMRKCFVARPGFLMVKCDYAGQELRIVTNLSNEPVWMKEFLEGTGDLHTITARAFFNKQEVTKEERQKGKCVHPGTLIFVNGGVQAIGELPFSSEVDSFRPLESVAIYDGHGWKSVTATYNGGRKPLLHVVTSGGILTCTPQHKFALQDGSFVPAGELKEGDALFRAGGFIGGTMNNCSANDLDLKIGDNIITRLNGNLAYFAGLYAGIGTGSSSYTGLAYDLFDHAWLNRLEFACDLCAFPTKRHEHSGILYLGGEDFVRDTLSYGILRKCDGELRIPFGVLKTGWRASLYYLGGLFDAEGEVEDTCLEWSTKDLVFGGQVATVLNLACMYFKVELGEAGSVRLKLSKESSWQMRDYMKRADKLDRLRDPQWALEEIKPLVVTKILPAGEGDCVDVTVEDSHVYVANGMVTHNTANFALVYGGGPAAIMRAVGCDKVEAQRKKQNFDKTVPKFAEWVKKQHAKVKKELGVYTAYGRWLAIPDANIKAGAIRGKSVMTEFDARAAQAACERHATNYPIQGCNQYNTWIITSQGYRKIGDLAKLGSEKTFLVWTGSKWATATAHNMGKARLARVKLTNGVVVRCDVRHKLLVVEPDGYKWVEFKDLKPSMKVALSLPQPLEFAPPKSLDLVASTKMGNFWYFMGLLYLFGSVRNDKIVLNRSEIHESIWTYIVKFCEEFNYTLEEKGKYIFNLRCMDIETVINKLGLDDGTDLRAQPFPDYILTDTLENRKAFARGFLQTMGKPLGELKTNFTPSPKIKPSLIRFLRGLGLTVNVREYKRGDYDMVDLRLTVRNLENALSSDRFNRSFVQRSKELPDFIFKEFNDNYVKQRDFSTALKAKPMYSTFLELVEEHDIPITQPLYDYEFIEEIKEFDKEEDTFTLSVQDPSHRFDADSVITKNSGADIMKIAMILIHKQLHLHGWLRNGGDDSVRMLLTVHDELVFEIRDHRVLEALEIITKMMEAPTGMVVSKHSPPWRVPLVTDPLIGDSWGSETGCRLLKGAEAKLKEGEKRIGNFAFKKIPEWLEARLTATSSEAKVVSAETTKGDPVTTGVEAPKEARETVPSEVKVASAPSVKIPEKEVTKPSQATQEVDTVVVVYLNRTTKQALSQVRASCAQFFDSNGFPLKMVDALTGYVIIDPKLGIRVEIDKFADKLFQLNLSNGKYQTEKSVK
jgi:DNA polymerase I-like protein with 3'-5' exonuclease and polymerase domains